MKSILPKKLALAAMLVGGMAVAGFAGNGNGPNGRGYGGPPASDQERAARQAACIQQNGGVCPNGGPRLERARNGQGRGQGRGMGWRRGACDGTGPRAGTTNCPVNNAKQVQK